MAKHTERESAWNTLAVILGVVMLIGTIVGLMLTSGAQYYTTTTVGDLTFGWVVVFGLLGWRWFATRREAEDHIRQEVGEKNGALARLEDERAAHRRTRFQLHRRGMTTLKLRIEGVEREVVCLIFDHPTTSSDVLPIAAEEGLSNTLYTDDDDAIVEAQGKGLIPEGALVSPRGLEPEDGANTLDVFEHGRSIEKDDPVSAPQSWRVGTIWVFLGEEADPLAAVPAVKKSEEGYIH